MLIDGVEEVIWSGQAADFCFGQESTSLKSSDELESRVGAQTKKMRKSRSQRLPHPLKLFNWIIRLK